MEQWEDFYSKAEKVVNKYFDLIYRAWQTSKEKDDHNSYLQNSATLKDIASKHVTKLAVLASQTVKVFSALSNS